MGQFIAQESTTNFLYTLSVTTYNNNLLQEFCIFQPLYLDSILPSDQQ
jgi:hypothetical protein